jgi:hypothetical protein
MVVFGIKKHQNTSSKEEKNAKNGHFMKVDIDIL